MRYKTNFYEDPWNYLSGDFMAEELFDEDEIKRDIIRVMGTLYQKGLVSAMGGNVSARLPGKNEFWITPSGVFKGDLHLDDLVKIDLKGNIVEGFMKPSIEWPMHAAVYKLRPDVNAVIHAHNPITTGLAMGGIPPQMITVEAVVFLRKVPVVDFVFPGTDELAEHVAKAVKETAARALVLQNHGVLGLGYNLVEAESVVEVLEEVAWMTLACIIAGKKELPLIPEKDIELAKKIYGF